eukprot:GHVU01226701.1.p1 GENE.GHVU01226701.1~~GHVU01226701.1.p1  ORF type:complete len:376 (+),score=65.29 GHVU01226701.1:86-1129(+)
MDAPIRAQASPSLSYIYFLEGDLQKAELFADLALREDRYSSTALINKGNCLYARADYHRAKEYYFEAIGLQTDSVEALFNIGLTNKHLKLYDQSLQAFEKLNSVLPNKPEVLFHIGDIYAATGKTDAALEFFSLLTSAAICPADADIFVRMGLTFHKLGDADQALSYFLEAYKCDPSNSEACLWLAAYFVKIGADSNAAQFFSRAAELNPKEPRWPLMAARCKMKNGNYEAALADCHRLLHQRPTHIDCLKLLIQLCKLTGLPHEEYQLTLNELVDGSVVSSAVGEALTQSSVAGSSERSESASAASAAAALQHEQKQPGFGGFAPGMSSTAAADAVEYADSARVSE